MTPIRWKDAAGLPSSCAAILSALQFNQPDAEGVQRLTDDEWRAALDFCDRAQLTLVLQQRCGALLPAWVDQRVTGNIDANNRRCARLVEEYFRIAQRLQEAGIAHIVLKGFTHVPLFVPALKYRLQADLDLLLDSRDLDGARQILLDLGFEAGNGQARVPMDHLPPFIRKTGWRWSGDFFDPDRPAVVEIHHRLWDEGTELFAVEGLKTFWDRRTPLAFNGRPLPSFGLADQFGYASLHAVRHLLRGDLKVFHVYELACFLEGQRERQNLWEDMRSNHSSSLHQVEAISAALAQAWFGCQLPGLIEQKIQQLPPPIAQWLSRYAPAPVIALFRPNKDELWLHLSLLSSWSRRFRLIRRRLAPLTLPGHVEANFVPAENLTPALRARKWVAYGRFLGSRAVFHAKATLSILAGSAAWWRMNRNAG